jgi:hypothetical protein
MIMLARGLTVAALSALAVTAAGSAPAEAGKKFRGFHGHHYGHTYHYHHRPRIRVYGYSSCGYYLKKWQYTGSRYWRKKYFQCKSMW